MRLKAYAGSLITMKGRVDIRVTLERIDHTLPLIIAQYAKGIVTPNLLGRDWSFKVHLNWQQILPVNLVNAEVSLKQKYSDVFEKGVSVIKDFKGSLLLKSTAKPIFCKAGPVPYALRESVEKELKTLEENKVIYRVQHSDWATPLAVAPKKDKSVRLCGYYCVTVNQHPKEDHYLLPLSEDIFAAVAGGEVFTALDLSKVYLQLKLKVHFQQALTVNTHLELFQLERLLYRVTSAPALFQSVMDKILRGIPSTACYLDDVLISGRTQEECEKNTECV